MSEISISRKVVRDGESEYYLNRVPCRLLDVKEFFMGTGVGARTYSLVEQGNVASLVEAKPEDRRLYIEDAAGVSKYKSRKDAAVRKMEATKTKFAAAQRYYQGSKIATQCYFPTGQKSGTIQGNKTAH